MKKTMALTSLLFAAGTALSSAVTLVSDYRFDGDLTNSVTENAVGGALTNGWAGSTGSGSTQFVVHDDGKALELTKNGGGAYDGVYGTDFSSLGSKWAMSIDVRLVGISSSYQTLIKFGAATGSDIGYQLLVGNGAGDWGSGFGFAAANTYGNRAMSTVAATANAWSTVSVISMGDGALHLYLDGKDITDTLTNTQGTGISGLSTAMDGTIKIGYNNEGGNYKLKDGTQLDNLKFWSVSDTDTLADVVSVVIPEPSAFGLLAGIGALALVASRRRRR